MRKGFSLIELLIYVSILGIISVLFIGILTTSTRVQVHEVALAEVGNQANFVLQTIQRLVRESSLIEEAREDDLGTVGVNEGDNDDTDNVTNKEVSYVKLRMKDGTKDPTCISLLEDGAIYVMQGAQGTSENCKDIPADGSASITTDKVTVPTDPLGLSLKLVSNSPARNILEVELTLDYANAPPGGDYSKKLRTAIGRVSAATFDSDLMPETTGGAKNIGQNIARWQNLYVNSIDVSEDIQQGGNYDGAGRGYMAIGAETGSSCTNICDAHGSTASPLTCNFVLGPLTSSGAGNTTPACSNTTGKRICFCQ